VFVVRRYRALLVGNWHYPDDPANLPDLKGPLNDVSSLAQTLADPTFGLFAPTDVTTLTERASYEIEAEMEAFFSEATREDVLLVYFSGHGITADNGSLLLCGRNSRTDRRLATTVSSETVNQMIRGCPAAAVVIVLDCCHAGAFKSGDIAGELAGRGRFVLTASRSKDRAPDAEDATGLSRFTGHLVRGIRGEAALPGSDQVTLSDLYRYVHRRMTEAGPIIPQRRFDGDGEVAIARTLTAPAVSLTVSSTQIDLGTVVEGESLPPERVQVTAAGSSWRAETEADWLSLEPHPHHLDIRITPRLGATRANIHVHHGATGEIRTIRLSLSVTPRRTAPPEQSIAPPEQSAAPPEQGPSPLERRPAPAEKAPAAALATVRLGQDEIAARVSPLIVRSPITAIGPLIRQEKAARKLAGVDDREATLGTVDLPGDGFVLFTNRAMYWTNQGQRVAVPYQQFPTRQFVLSPRQTHVDFGDGVPRLVGGMAPDIFELITEIRTALLAR
jgi:hypothetical protein